ncbi:hypothetical protein Adi01nite_70730 [Amorphoplanes digitatis]|nr:hypothetical protein GCM10020092_081110 [Actinoplanes digitatis]GID97661.1 hypothetical protein Adi01nite_70730 [Actinoplanes digitatis]
MWAIHIEVKTVFAGGLGFPDSAGRELQARRSLPVSRPDAPPPRRWLRWRKPKLPQGWRGVRDSEEGIGSAESRATQIAALDFGDGCARGMEPGRCDSRWGEGGQRCDEQGEGEYKPDSRAP